MNNEALNEFWAKSPTSGGTGETLVQHTEAVLIALRYLAELKPELHHQAHCERLWHWLFWAGCFHDLGKLASGFQRQLREDFRWGFRHEVLSLAFLDWLKLEEEDEQWIVAAIISHHKDLGDLRSAYPADMKPDEDSIQQMTRELPRDRLDDCFHIWSAQCENWRTKLGFDLLGAEPYAFCWTSAEELIAEAPTSICKRAKKFYRFAQKLINSSQDNPDRLFSILVRGSLILADHKASSHLSAPAPTLKSVEDLLQVLGMPEAQLYDHQQQCAATNGSLLLTAPTGSGKTESALLWAARQMEEIKGHPRLYYVLPFQASMNAMRTRLNRAFPNEVGIQHGRSLHALYNAYLQGETTANKAMYLAQLSKNLSRLQAYPIKVLSPYQLLKACYRLKGYETVFTDGYTGLYIFDEMHAYEPKRLAMIVGMIRYMAENFKARFCVMTATLPPPIVTCVQAAVGEIRQVKANRALAERYKRHQIHAVEGEIINPNNLAKIATQAKEQQSVLICCNTVQRAQDVYLALKSLLKDTKKPITLLHSRFNARDRLTKEGSWAGSQTTPVRPHGVLVATQVVEVSLNLDFDIIFTEPAPLEAILQRFGRVNRLASRPPAPSYVFSEPTNGQHIYDPLMIKKTLEILHRADHSVIDEAKVSDWLEKIYDGEILLQWSESFQSAMRSFEHSCLNNIYAFSSDDALEDAFYKAFDNIDVLPQCFAEEYNQLKDTEPMKASELFVGISYNRYHQLKRHFLIQPGVLPIVNANYSEELGLQF